VLPVLAPQAQSQPAINIALGPTGSAPSATYAAAGLPGVWNDIGLTANGQRVPLVGLDGIPIAADIRQIGATSVLQSDDPATTGDDAALLDSMVLSFSDPLDACYWIDNLPNAAYIVTLYALTPNDPDLLSPVRVDDGTPGSTPVGGAWTGTHIQGVSYQSFVVEVTGNEIGLHSGIPGGNIQSGLNGIQIRPVAMVGAGLFGEALEISGLVSAFPNPASGAQTIEIRLSAPARAATLQVFDVHGRVVWMRDLDGLAQGRSFVIWDGRQENATNVAPGIYFARLSTPLGTAQSSLRLVRTP
jgi:hypothetical protein